MSQTRFNRRKFLSGSAVAAFAVPTLVSAQVLGGPNRPGANDKIRVGLIGPGYRARDLFKESPAELEFVSLSDCDLRQLAAFRKWEQENLPGRLAKTCHDYQDYRQMFDKEKLDAVMIPSTTHARVLICIRAMQAGLDVYAEKPLTLTVEEGQYLIRAERKIRSRLPDGHAAAIDSDQ